MKKHAIIFASLALSCLVLSAPLSAGAVSSSQTEASSLYIITVQPELPVTERSELELTALEMTQNSERLSWTFDEVNEKLEQIMINIYHNIDDAAKRYGMEGNYVAGANIAGFEKVANAMLAQGVC